MPPIVLEPYSRPQVWGGTRLQSRYGKTAPPNTLVGESWEVSGHALHTSRVAEGPLAGMSLNELWQTHRHTWCPDPELVRHERFPWLIKLLDCQEPSSLQVHPDDRQAARLRPGESGKTEAWYVLEADATSRLYTGLKSGVTDAELRRRLRDGTVLDVLHSVTPKAGEAYLIPAGLVHAIGAGLVLFEIEQCSDLTWRLFDWNRVDAAGKPRELHIEAALECLDWSLPPAVAAKPDICASQAAILEERLLACRWFVMDRITLTTDAWPIPASGLTAWFVVEGAGQLENSAETGSLEFQRGQTILVPPNDQPQRWLRNSCDKLQLLRCTWPGSVP
ncbi:MAG TPA: type I phosphomannose isomerase catalytic subunit [Planctomycetaceae bacterium]|nr:type I phosphomannose isomerase catalytic subunit [Planctomycetaceae bacterium]